MIKFPGISSIYFSVILFCFFPVSLFGEIILTIEPPELSEGYAQLETVMEEAVESASENITALLDPYANKNLLLTGFSRASRSIIVLPRHHFLTAVSAGFGIYGGLSPVTLNFRSIYEEAARMQARDDLDAGGAAVPLVGEADFKLPFLNRFSFSGYGGYFRDVPETYSFSTLTAGFGSEYSLISSAEDTAFSFSGISLGISLRYSLLAIIYSFPDIDRSIQMTVDPDGDGPIPGMIGSVDISGTLEGGIQSRTLGGLFYGRTGFSFRNIFGLTFALGIDIADSRSRITAGGEGDISAGGGFSSVQESPGTYSLKGFLDEERTPLVLPVLSSALTFRTGPLVISFPVTFLWTHGFSAGISNRITL